MGIYQGLERVWHQLVLSLQLLHRDVRFKRLRSDASLIPLYKFLNYLSPQCFLPKARNPNQRTLPTK
jgi:hypothetical protein